MEVYITMVPSQQSRMYIIEPNQALSALLENVCRHLFFIPNVNPADYCLRLAPPEETLITEMVRSMRNKNN
jgi:hypothetical protein